MADGKKFSSQLPAPVYERFFDLDHGQKQTACAAALVWYFNADSQTQRIYREWARAIGEGLATIDEPPESVGIFLRHQRRASANRRKKGVG